MGERDFFESLDEISRGETGQLHDPLEAARLEAQEAEARAKEAFFAALRPGPLDGTWTCPLDGVVVADRDAHFQFHVSLRETAAEASDAAFHHRPIG